MIRRYVQFIVGRPKLIIFSVLALTLVLALQVFKLRIELDVDEQLPANNPLIVLSKRIEKSFGGKYLTIIGIYPKHGTIFTIPILKKIKRITEKIARIPGVKPSSLISLMSKNVKDIRSNVAQIEVAPLSSGVPKTPKEMRAFRERVLENQSTAGLLVNNQGTATVIIFDFDDFEKAGGAKGFYPALEKILRAERVNGVEMISTGTPALLYWLLVYTTRIAYLFILALVMIGFLHYRAFRTLQGMFIPLVTALMGVVWATGLMGLLGVPMDPWNIMTPILLLAIGAGHSVQILKRYYEEYENTKNQHPELAADEQNCIAVIEATTKVGTVMLAAGAIAALSFASLVTLGLPSIRSFGLFSGFGILAALIVEMTFIPAMRRLLPPPNRRQSERERQKEIFDPLLNSLASMVRKKKEGLSIFIFLILIIFAVIGVFKLEIGNSLAAQFFESNGLMRGFRLADRHTAGTRVLQILIETQQPGGIKEALTIQRMDQLEKYLSNQRKTIGKVVSLVDVLKEMNRVLNSGKKADAVLPATRGAIAQYLFLYQMSGEKSGLERLVDENYQKGVIVAYLRTDDQKAIKLIMDGVNKEISRIFKGSKTRAAIGGGVANAVALNDTMVNGKIKNLIQICTITTLITALILRSFLAGLLVLLPLASSALLNLGLMGWSGIMLTMGTSAISAMAVGIGADYAIYFIFRVKEEYKKTNDLRKAVERAQVTSGKAIAYVATAVAGGYLCLALSLFKVHVLLGVLVALTMVSCCLGTVAFLPAVIVKLGPKFLMRRQSKVYD